jgi:hypothetical protein
VFLTSTVDQDLYSVGWEADVQAGGMLYAWVYEAAEYARGALLSYGSIECEFDGTRWHDIPVSASLEAGRDYNIEIGFARVNSWRYWEDFDGVPYDAGGSFSVYQGSQGGNPYLHRIIHMRAYTCDPAVSAVYDPGTVQPARFALAVPRPNPISSSMRIAYDLDAGGPVTITVYDVRGRKVVEMLRSDHLSPGAGSIELDTRDIAAGVYFVTMQSGNRTVSRKITIIR